jgi:hypothetical protein
LARTVFAHHLFIDPTKNENTMNKERERELKYAKSK